MCAHLTTEFQFSSRSESTQNKTSEDPLKILVIGDFSGRESLGDCAPDSAVERPFIRLDKDNFESIFSGLHVRLQTPFCEAPIEFQSFEMLHPDTLLEALPLFAPLITGLRRLKRCKVYADGVAILRQAGVKVLDTLPHAEDPSEMSKAQALDAAIDGFDQQPVDTLQGLIQSFVQPFSEPKADDRIEVLQNTLEQALTDTLRLILGYRDFKSLEASWRTLDWLIREMDTDRLTQLSIWDVSRAELNEIFDSKRQHLVDHIQCRLGGAQGVTQGNTFDIVCCEHLNQQGLELANLAETLSRVCAHTGTALFMDFDTRAIGVESFFSAPNHQAWSNGAAENIPSGHLWEKVRACHNVYVFAPKVLVRYPFGERTAPLDSFVFEELDIDTDSEHWRQQFLWGSASLFACIVAERLRHLGRDANIEVDGLPFFAMSVDEQDIVQPSTSVVLSDLSVNALRQLGVNVLLGRSDKNSFQVRSLAPAALGRL